MPEVDRGRCDSRNMLGVIMKIDLTKNLYKIGTKDGILNLLHTLNQFTICKEGTVKISNVPLMFRYENVPGKHHYLVSKDIKDATAKHLAEIIFLRAESQISCATLSAIIVCHEKPNDIHVGTYHIFIYLCFSFLSN